MNTFILIWEPSASRFQLLGDIEHLIGKSYEWRINGRKHFNLPQIGDRFFLIKSAENNYKIIMSGSFSTEIYMKDFRFEHGGIKSIWFSYQKIDADIIIDFNLAPQLTTLELLEYLPNENLEDGLTAKILDYNMAAKIERFWQTFICYNQQMPQTKYDKRSKTFKTLLNRIVFIYKNIYNITVNKLRKIKWNKIKNNIIL